MENSTYHTNFEKSVTDRLGTKADKTTVEQQLGTKADKSNTYTKDEVNSKVAPKADKGYVDSELNKKADKATTYTKTEVDNKIAGQVKSVNGHTANASGAVTLPTLKANVLTGYDVKNKTATFDNNAHFDANGVFSRWPVDQGVIGQLADAINAKLPIEAGNPNGDLLDHAGNKIEYWNGNGQNVKNLPPMGTNKKWYFAIKLVGPGGWGSVTVIDQDGTYWLNTRNDVWTGWKSITTNETLKRVKFVKQSLDQNGNIFQDTKFVTQEADGTYKINIFDSDWTAYKVAWLLKNTKSYSIENNTDLNNVKNTGFYNAAGTSGLKNSPVSAWFSMSVNANQWNGQQTLYDTNSGQLYVRTWNPTRFTDWQIIANAGDLTNQSITSITDYDVASEGWHNTQVGKFDPSGHFSNFLVDAGALKPIAEAINNLNTNLTTMRTELMNLKKRTDYNTPQGEFNNTTVNLNDLRSTGMYRLSNCYVQSGPYPTNNAHWVYVKVTVFDANTVYQTLYEGDNMYGRKSYSTTNWGQWHQYLNKTV
ncbi:hypothetical protein HMPREF9209_0616 [Lactobacillus gasseri 224-1]|uniref:Uncharacterized protein n=1 Tax=Lactobacillus gasseri 224-1 TaxID=679196 RepID=D1YHQ6_LACGS|nr:hypothetical protein HMPREF9209_0616 [Lactobacillus gasseri 224-1]